MNASCICVRREGTTTRVTLARPGKGNSLSGAMVCELSAAIAACHADGTRALLVDAAGPNFCTGFDLSDLEHETDDSLLARFVRVELLLQQVHRAPFVTAALARGKTWGAGADLFAACSMRWATMDATFAFPGAAFGLVLGSGRLGALVGPAHAGCWILRGGLVTQPQASAAGLVQHVLDPSLPTELEQTLAQWVHRLDCVTQTQVLAALRPRSEADDATDLARLVASAARPGLQARIVAYRAALRAPK